MKKAKDPCRTLDKHTGSQCMFMFSLVFTIEFVFGVMLGVCVHGTAIVEWHGMRRKSFSYFICLWK